jgi:hypothetical protein
VLRKEADDARLLIALANGARGRRCGPDAKSSIELPPTAYQFKFGKITKALAADTMVKGTLVFEKLHSVPIEFMVEQDDTAPKED